MQLKPGAVSTCISIITSADNYIEMINFVSGPKGVCVGGGGGGAIYTQSIEAHVLA